VCFCPAPKNFPSRSEGKQKPSYNINMLRKFPNNLRKEFAVFKKLNTPAKIQDFVNALPFNFEHGGDTYWSPLEVLRRGTAHCMEGAMLAAAALWYHGARPLLIDLRVTKQKSVKDVDHAVAPFTFRGRWGAVSKTNHGVLRYRESVYRDPRELAMSYFHEYFLNDGRKTLREYSAPFDLSRYGDTWLTGADVSDVVIALDDARHYPVASPAIVKTFRRADPVERETGKIVEWKKGKSLIFNDNP